MWRFLVLAVLCALSIYSGLAGPLGRRLDHGAADLLGGARVLLPVALAYLGWIIIRDRERSACRPAGRSAGRRPAASRPARQPATGVAGPGTGRRRRARCRRRAGWPSARWSCWSPWPAWSTSSTVPATGVGSRPIPVRRGRAVGTGVGVPLRAGIGPRGAGWCWSPWSALALLVVTGTPARDAVHWLGRRPGHARPGPPSAPAVGGRRLSPGRAPGGLGPPPLGRTTGRRPARPVRPGGRRVRGALARTPNRPARAGRRRGTATATAPGAERLTGGADAGAAAGGAGGRTDAGAAGRPSAARGSGGRRSAARARPPRPPTPSSCPSPSGRPPSRARGGCRPSPC